MKPVQLTVEGLHSFQDRQSIDFSSLTQGGVFGIFGPTGSGKSSLLDAMTLALYGKVERAANNTKGILNHASEKLHVSFTFELGEPGGVSYFVERAYKPNKTGGLTIAHCRLVRKKAAEETVLADKERDVTAEVTEILGLTHEDFTRAVVLPQGNFAEFLSLKGKARREMLERLFNLEKYGERLSQGMRQKYYQAEAELNSVAARIEQLGAPTREEIDALSKHLESLASELKSARTESEQVEKDYAAAGRLRETLKAYEDAKARYQKLKAKEPEITSMKNKIKNARLAASIKPLMDETESLESQYKTAEQKKREAKQVYESLSLEETAAAKEASRKAEERELQEPEILAKASELKNLVEEEKQLRDVQRKIKDLKREKEQTKAQLIKIKEALAQEEQEKKDQAVSLKEMKKEISKLEESPDDQKQLQKALDKKKDIDFLEKQLAAHRNDWKKAHDGRKPVLEDEKQIQNRLDKNKQTAAQLFKGIEKLFSSLSCINEALKKVAVKISSEKRNNETALDRLRTEHLAEQLKQNLKPGDPCPVCGSLDHVHTLDSGHRADGTNEALVHARDEREQLQKQETWLQNQEQEIKGYLLKLEHLAERASDSGIELPAFSEPTDNAPDPFKAGTSLRETLKGMEQDKKAAYQDLLGYQKKIDEQVAEHKEIKDRLRDIDSAKTRYVDKLEQIESQAERLKADLEKHVSDFGQQFPHFPLEELAERQRKAEEDGEKRRLLNEKINNSQTRLENIQNRIEPLQKQYYEVEQQLNGKENEMKFLADNASRLECKIEKVADADTTIEEAIQKNAEQLERLKAGAQQAMQKAEQYRNKRFEQEKNYYTLKQNAESLAERNEEKLQEFARALKEAGFDDSKALKEAFIDTGKLEMLETEAVEFDQQISGTKQEKNQLSDSLDGRTLTEEAYHELENKRHDIKAEIERLIEERAAAHRDFEQLKENFERCKELDKEKERLTKISDDWKQLQQIFKGNTFVEYVAEEQLIQICRDASKRLGELTRGRYGLEIDEDGGFIIRDDHNGGLRRPVSSLSGGETFLTSLALALSLSATIQLRGEVPLQFFFLDEGFGTLDTELLDIVVTALEKLHMNNMAIGVISHVPELQERLSHKLYVEPASVGGKGSRVREQTPGSVLS